MTITTYTSFSKKRNSTAQPTGGTSHTATLKNPCSVEHPVFVLRTNASNITYAAAFGHYYFVDDIVHINNDMIELHCSNDALATHKSEITGSYQYVARANDQTQADYTIFDERYPIKTNPTINKITPATQPPFTLSTASTVVLTIKGSTGSLFAAFPYSEWNDIGHDLYGVFNQNDLWNVLGITVQDFAKNFLDPMQFITNAVLLPISFSDINNYMFQSGNLALGYWVFTDPDASMFKYTLPVCYTSTTYSISPSALEPTLKYLNSNRCRRYHLILPGAGIVELDGDVLTSGNISIDFNIDTTGAICYKIRYGSGSDYTKIVGGQIGIPIAIHGTTSNYQQTIGSMTNVLGGQISALLSFNPINMATSGVIGIAHNLANAGPLINTHTRGSDGSFAGLASNMDIMLIEQLYDQADIGPVRLGYPVCKYLQLSSLSGGYVECERASVDINGFAGDRETIESALNTGIYIE